MQTAMEQSLIDDFFLGITKGSQKPRHLSELWRKKGGERSSEVRLRGGLESDSFYWIQGLRGLSLCITVITLPKSSWHRSVTVLDRHEHDAVFEAKELSGHGFKLYLCFAEIFQKHQ